MLLARRWARISLALSAVSLACAAVITAALAWGVRPAWWELAVYAWIVCVLDGRSQVLTGDAMRWRP